MSKQLTKAEQYVFAKLALEKLWNELTATERDQADVGLRWVHFDGVAPVVKKRRGRPPKIKEPESGNEDSV